jgi:hypothetical protein
MNQQIRIGRRFTLMREKKRGNVAYRTSHAGGGILDFHIEDSVEFQRKGKCFVCGCWPTIWHYAQMPEKKMKVTILAVSKWIRMEYGPDSRGKRNVGR